jgi:hypothetical protein
MGLSYEAVLARRTPTSYKGSSRRAMTNAPWYVSNDTLHNDLGIPIISDVIKERSNKLHNRLETNTSPFMQPLLEEPNFRRLKRRLPIDLKWISGGSFDWRVPHPVIVGLTSHRLAH